MLQIRRGSLLHVLCRGRRCVQSDLSEVFHKLRLDLRYHFGMPLLVDVSVDPIYHLVQKVLYVVKFLVRLVHLHHLHRPAFAL